MMNTKKFGELYFFHPKSKIPAKEGIEKGKFPFYTSSTILKKRIDISEFNTQALIFGTGGSASIHYEYGQFSVSTDCLVASSKQENVNIKYTYYYLLYNMHFLESGFKGAGLKHISKIDILNIKIKFPDLETQDKIVSILDRASTIVKKRKNSILIYDQLEKAIFFESFSKFQKSNIKNLDELAYVESGLTKGKKYGTKNTRMFPYMRVANVQDGYINLSSIKEIKATEEEASHYKLEEHDILLTEGGDPDKLGRGTYWENQIDNCIYQNHIFRVRIKDKNIVNPIFLSFQLSSHYGKYFFLKAAKQTSGIASINSTQLKSFPVYLPPADEQKKFQQTIKKCETNKVGLKRSLQEYTHLLESISQLAFEGELTFNTAVELDVLLDNNYDFFKEKSSTQTIQLLLDRLNKSELNEKKFYDRDQYNKAKTFAFSLLQEGEIQQVFDKETKSVKLTLA